MTRREDGRTPRFVASTPGRFAYDGLDRVFHEKARLGIMTSLMTSADGLSFSDLKTLCTLSDGNLNRHLAVLQEAGVVDVEKEGGGRGSRTRCLVTQIGRTAFLEYLAELERVIADAVAARDQPPPTKSARISGPLRPGWSTS